MSSASDAEIANIKSSLFQIKAMVVVAIIVSVIPVIQIAMICHPGRANVELQNGRHIRLENASIGDLIRTPSGYEPIVAFTHAAPDIKATYFRITTKSASIDIARGHWLVVNGREVDPKVVSVGDVLKVARPGTADAEEPVLRIEEVIERGAYHPITPSGRYYVDGVLASIYTKTFPESVAKRFLPYLEFRYWIGAPVDVGRKGELVNPWLLVEAAGPTLRPIGMGAAGLAEIANCMCASFVGNSLLAVGGLSMLARRSK